MKETLKRVLVELRAMRAVPRLNEMGFVSDDYRVQCDRVLGVLAPRGHHSPAEREDRRKIIAEIKAMMEKKHPLETMRGLLAYSVVPPHWASRFARTA